MQVTPDSERQGFVLKNDGAFTFVAFGYIQRLCNTLAGALGRADLAISDAARSTLAAYTNYQAAVAAWADSPLNKKTLFDPDTAPEVTQILERYRKSEQPLRLVYGDIVTGKDWCEECDVVGIVGRSTGPLRVPLMIEFGQQGGSTILTTRVLVIIDPMTRRCLYKHPSYQSPVVHVEHEADADLPFCVLHDGKKIARFDNALDAHELCAFFTLKVPMLRVHMRAMLDAQNGRTR